ncbi:MAG: hypothetical protein PVF74_03235 [Anaerolineales bacterium]|jgi:hypothetical protein
MIVNNASPAIELGYWFHPSDWGYAPGGNRLDIVIKESESGIQFTPQIIHIPVKSKHDAIESLVIGHPWKFANDYRACAGLVEILDQKDEKIEAFTFGGRLVIEEYQGLTMCILTSSAPILEISSATTNLMMLIEEIEILFAERSAAMLSDPHAFERNLVSADPMELYLACLDSLIGKFEHFSHKENPRILRFLNFLHAEKSRLKKEGLLKLYVPSLEEIL